jgi:hypothetical protein
LVIILVYNITGPATLDDLGRNIMNVQDAGQILHPFDAFVGRRLEPTDCHSFRTTFGRAGESLWHREILGDSLFLGQMSTMQKIAYSLKQTLRFTRVFIMLVYDETWVHIDANVPDEFYQLHSPVLDVMAETWL